MTRTMGRLGVAIVLAVMLSGCGVLERLRGEGAGESAPAAEAAKPESPAQQPAETAKKEPAAPDMEVLPTPVTPPAPVEELQPLEPEPVSEDAVAQEPSELKAEESPPEQPAAQVMVVPPNTFVVEVQEKTDQHPYYGKGSQLGFVVDGVPGKAIVVQRGKTYTFRVRTNIKHDFYLSRKDVGWGSAVFSRGVEGQFTYKGDVSFTPDEQTPDTLYYECRNHQYMGGRIVVVDAGADVEAVKARLREERKAALAKRAKAVATGVSETQARQKLAYVKMLFQFKSKTLAAPVKQGIESKLQAAAEAMAAQDFAMAYALADEAGRAFASGPEARGPSDAELAKQRDDYELKLETVHSFQKSHQRAFDEAQKSGGAIKPVDYDHAKVDALVVEAARLAKQNQYPQATRKLASAEREITVALNGMLGSRTVVFELKFDTPADEYRYEVERYKSYLVLIPKAIEVRKPSQGAIKLAQTYVDKGKFFAEKAEESAQAGRYAEAIVIVKDATKEVRRGLMILGVSM